MFEPGVSRFLLTDELRAAMLAHAEDEFPRECCGLLVHGADEGTVAYMRCANVAPLSLEGQDQFVLDPDALMAAEDFGEVLAIVHSHPSGHAHPSMADRVGCEQGGLPWLIVAWPGGTIKRIEPGEWSAPLVGRRYQYGVLDCYTLVQDYYRRRLGTTLPDMEHGDDKWWERAAGEPGVNLVEAQFEQAGFVAVEGAPQIHDLLLMRLSARVVSHCAIYTGDDRMLHHPYQAVSCHDTYDDTWRRRTVVVARHISRIRPDEAAALLLAA